MSTHKKIFMMAAIICIYIAGLGIPGYCQDDNAMEQTESQMGENLESEISSEQTEGKAEEEKADSEFEAGEPMSL